MRVERKAAFILTLVAGMMAGQAALAQSADVSGLADRVNRLERDLNAVEAQVYRNGGSSSEGGTAPANGGAIAGDAYSMLDQRINALENQMRDLTGQIEKQGYTLNQLQDKLERMNKDNDLRFKDLEAKAGVGGPPSGAPPQGQPPANGAPPPADGKGGQWNPTMGSPPTTLGQVPAGDLKQEQRQVADEGNQQTPEQHKPGALPGNTPQEKYDYAFGLLRNNDYQGATEAFKLFVSQYPKNSLAGNAVYWLGQIPYSQGNYDAAAHLFYEAYHKYPKSAKAPESLLKVGLSFSKLNKKKEACVVFQRFLTEYPDAADSMRRQAKQEKRKMGC